MVRSIDQKYRSQLQQNRTRTCKRPSSHMNELRLANASYSEVHKTPETTASQESTEKPARSDWPDPTFHTLFLGYVIMFMSELHIPKLLSFAYSSDAK